jgi:hypothetical protein
MFNVLAVINVQCSRVNYKFSNQAVLYLHWEVVNSLKH